MLKKISLVIWFILRPKYYLYFFSLIKRKFLFNYDTLNNKKKAYDWAKSNSTSYVNALKKLDIKGEAVGLDSITIKEGQKIVSKTSIKMGGSGHVHLLYDCVRLLRANKVIETGVAYGWSSLAILKGLFETTNGKLISVDMPYPQRNNESYVGIVVPPYLKKNWILIRKPDNPGIFDALKIANSPIDLCHYDSDKSWWGRNFAYPILWASLRSGGLFISDDIQDNLFFCEFIKDKSSNFAVVEFDGKFVGLIKK